MHTDFAFVAEACKPLDNVIEAVDISIQSPDAVLTFPDVIACYYFAYVLVDRR